MLEVASKDLAGTLCASTPDEADPRRFDLVILAMQEPQYGAPGVRELMGRIARARRPCLAIMNMPPLPYLKRIPGLVAGSLHGCYTDAAVWDAFEPGLVTLASPDAQAFRAPDQPKNVLEVRLATNFKVARFEAEAHTALLRELEADIDSARLPCGDSAREVPVKLKVHDSLFVPLAKWPMLLAGNYRCIKLNGMISIEQAVHGDLDGSQEIYEWVARLCERLGAAPGDLVAFERYAQVAVVLGKPSSAARAVSAGARHIERVDRLVWRIACLHGEHSDRLDEILMVVDERLRRNRLACERIAA